MHILHTYKRNIRKTHSLNLRLLFCRRCYWSESIRDKNEASVAKNSYLSSRNDYGLRVDDAPSDGRRADPVRRNAPLYVNLDPFKLFWVDVAALTPFEDLFASLARLCLRALSRVTSALMILFEDGRVARHLLDLAGLAAVG